MTKETSSMSSVGAPPLLMEGLDEVKASGLCNMYNYACVILALEDLGYGLQADWLEENIDSYNEILIHEFSQWLHANPRPFRDTCNLGHVVNKCCTNRFCNLLTCPKMVLGHLNFCTLKSTLDAIQSLKLAH